MDQSAMTITIYTYDAHRVFAGAVEADPMDAVPPGLLNAPPATTGAQVAQAHGDAWVVLPAYPPNEPLSVPEQVPMLNARLALIEKGHMANVNTVLAASPGIDGEKARTFFQFAQNVRRDHPVVEVLRAALGLTAKQIDDLFILALTFD